MLAKISSGTIEKIEYFPTGEVVGFMESRKSSTSQQEKFSSFLLPGSHSEFFSLIKKHVKIFSRVPPAPPLPPPSILKRLAGATVPFVLMGCWYLLIRKLMQEQ